MRDICSVVKYFSGLIYKQEKKGKGEGKGILMNATYQYFPQALNMMTDLLLAAVNEDMIFILFICILQGC